MQIICLAGSLRAGSINKRLARVADARIRAMTGVESTFLDLADYPLPVYNQDIETSQFPEKAIKLSETVAAAQGLVIATPENNGAIAAVLKNTVDWLSRTPKNPWPAKWILLLGASPGALGAIRGLWHSRVPFEALGCFVYPEMFGLPRAHEAFSESGDLKDAPTQARLDKLLSAFVTTANPTR